MTFVELKRVGAMLVATVALGITSVQAAEKSGATQGNVAMPASARADGVNPPERWYYLGSSASSKTYIDRQQKLRREGDTVTLSIRQVLDTVPDDLKVHPRTRYMDVRSRYDCKKHTVAHLSSLELSADNEYLGGEPRPLDPVPVHEGTLNAAVMDVACSAG
ncbi:surface-adhesin E family protein [Stenotrophomonas sp.]|uniref:surface-adhesin E family protein n=1 Tax=Stenotrophomonas sp. TaxID=69392 RepID=UPI0028ADE630|nr:surface-adhesin E family protein [Stenotrophomonas sp.]